MAFHEGRRQAVQFGEATRYSQNLVDVGNRFSDVGAIKVPITHSLHSTFALFEQGDQEQVVCLEPSEYFPWLDEQ